MLRRGCHRGWGRCASPRWDAVWRALRTQRVGVASLALAALTSVAAVGCSKERGAPAAAPTAAAPARESLPSAPPALADSLGARSDSGSALGTAARGAALAGDSLVAAMMALEDSLSARPDDPRSAPLYLRLGRLKQRYAHTLSKEDPYVQVHAEEFHYFEPGGDYYYTGYHFRQLVERFPASAVADSAAWELAETSPGSDCEGDVPCWLSSVMPPVGEFLGRYPNSPLAAEAVRRVNGAFTDALEPYADLTASTERFPSQTVQGALESYQEMVEPLPPAVRARAAEPIADLWARFRRYDRARALYEWLLATPAAGADTASVRRRLLALPSATFLLHPARVISDTRVELTWDRVSGGPVGRYVVFRSSAEAERGGQLAELDTAAGAPDEPLRYSDSTAQPGADHWYRVVARLATGEIVSNPVLAQPPARVLVRALLYNAADQHVYVFGYLENWFPRVLRVSESGAVDSPGDGGLLGLGRRMNDSTQERYLTDAWFIDPTGQAFLRFHKSATGFTEANQAAIRAGLRFAGDMSALTVADVLVSVDPRSRQMRVGWDQDLEARSCDWQNAICWEGRGSSIREVDLQGKTLRDIHLPLAFARAIHADSRDRSVWAYRAGAGALIHVDSAGAVVESLPLARPAHQSVPLAFDLAHRWVWAAVQGRLIKRGLDGHELANVPVVWWGEPLLAPDTVSGALWLLSRAGLLRFDRDAKRVLEIQLPGVTVRRP